ncbi:MAG: hypothetical protein ABJ004_03930 [Cyclobacteriaceae bacterium]
MHRFLIITLFALLLGISCRDKESVQIEQANLPIQVMSIGEGRNDGVSRCYGVIRKSLFEFGDLEEYTYDNGSWKNTATLSDYRTSWVEIHDLTNDNQAEVVSLEFAYFPESYDIAWNRLVRQTFENDLWVKDTVYAPPQGSLIRNVEVGQFSDPPKKSMVVYESTGGSPGKLVEVYFADGLWQEQSIQHFSPNTDYIVNMTAADLLGEGKSQLYFITWRGQLSYVKKDSGWSDPELIAMDSLPEGTSRSYHLFAIGGDINALFLLTSSELQVYAHDQHGWSRQTSYEGFFGWDYLADIHYGDWRNDEINRLYIPAPLNRLYEVSPLQREIKSYGYPGSLISDIVIGDGRDDGVNRIYALSYSTLTEIREWTY